MLSLGCSIWLQLASIHLCFVCYCLQTKPLLIDLLRASRDDQDVSLDACEVFSSDMASTPPVALELTPKISRADRRDTVTSMSSHTGYAFSHEGGFGSLITTGRNISEEASPERTHNRCTTTSLAKVKASEPVSTMPVPLPGGADTENEVVVV